MPGYLVGFVVIVDDLAGLGSGQADTLRQAEGFDGVSDREIHYLRPVFVFPSVLFVSRSENETGRF